MSRRAYAAGFVVAALTLAGCTSSTPEAPPSPAASAPAGATGAPSAATAEPVEPTTTNTLPPPPEPTGPAPTTSGPLSAAALPVPTGWRTVEPPGNDEIGQPGNGSWVQAVDPRYAAQGAISVGCADVTRDDYPDPDAALEGGYAQGDDPGVGLALEFASNADAAAYWQVYVRGVRACAGGAGEDTGISTTRISEPALEDGQGLVDRRTDETQEPTDWTEVGALHGTRVVLLNLGDPGHRTSDAAALRLLAAVPA